MNTKQLAQDWQTFISWRNQKLSEISNTAEYQVNMKTINRVQDELKGVDHNKSFLFIKWVETHYPIPERHKDLLQQNNFSVTNIEKLFNNIPPLTFEGFLTWLCEMELNQKESIQ